MTYQRLRFISGIILVIGHVFWLDQAMGLITGQILMGLSGKDFSAVLLFTLGAVGILLSSYHQKWLLLTAIANMWSYLFILWETTLAHHPPHHIVQLATDYVLSTTSPDATIAHITAGIVASGFIFFAAFQNHIGKTLQILGKYALSISAIIYGSIQVFIFYNFIHTAHSDKCHTGDNQYSGLMGNEHSGLMGNEHSGLMGNEHSVLMHNHISPPNFIQTPSYSSFEKGLCQAYDLPETSIIIFSAVHLIWIFAYVVLILSDKNLYHLIFKRNKLVL